VRSSAGTSRKHVLASALIACYLAVQLALPLFVVARPGPTWRDFSWDMFSRSVRCGKVDAVARTPRGAGSVRLSEDFGSWAQLNRVLLPGRLEAYAAHLCPILQRELGAPVELPFVAECHDDRRGPTLDLVDSRRDYCARR